MRYNLVNGTKLPKKIFPGLAAGLSVFALAFSVFLTGVGAKALAATYTLTPWTYVGAAGDCGPGSLAGTAGNVTSQWDNTVGNPAPSLYLAKTAPTTDCSSAGATVNGVSGITLTQVAFDYKTGEYCGAGAPRFNVDATDGSHFIGGCANGTQTDLGNGWTHVTIDPTSTTQAFPPIAAGATVNSMNIVFDEQGATHIDNVTINGTAVTETNVPTTKDACKDNGWVNLTDTNGAKFKNQGQCVAYVNHHDGKGADDTHAENS